LNRIFGCLAAFAMVCLMATFLLGLSLRAGNIHDRTDLAAQKSGTVHRLAGIATGLVVLLANSVVVTYFVGTSRWCKEVVETYSLDRELIRRSTRLKRATFPVAVVSMLIAVGIVALGGAADPGAIMPTPSAALHLPLGNLTWGNIHLVAAGLGIAAIGYGFFLAWNNILANHAVITDVLSEVKRIRTERGLDL
jgi:hypothetical protein